MKLWERVIDQRLRNDISTSGNQFSLIRSRSITKAISFLTRLVELCSDRKKDFHIMFIDLENVQCRVTYEVLWRYLDKKGVSVTYIQVINDMYEGVKTSISTFA